MRLHRREHGSILIITLLVLAALTIIGVATISLSGFDGELAITQRSGDQALYVAEAGIHYGANKVKGDTTLISGHTETASVNNGSGSVSFPGVSQPAEMTINIGPSPLPNGGNVECGLVGYSDRFGTIMFKVESTGKGPGGATRQVEAHLRLPPAEGLCPPGQNVKGGYQGG